MHPVAQDHSWRCFRLPIIAVRGHVRPGWRQVYFRSLSQLRQHRVSARISVQCFPQWNFHSRQRWARRCDCSVAVAWWCLDVCYRCKGSSWHQCHNCRCTRFYCYCWWCCHHWWWYRFHCSGGSQCAGWYLPRGWEKEQPWPFLHLLLRFPHWYGYASGWCCVARHSRCKSANPTEREVQYQLWERHRMPLTLAMQWERRPVPAVSCCRHRRLLRRVLSLSIFLRFSYLRYAILFNACEDTVSENAPQKR